MGTFLMVDVYNGDCRELLPKIKEKYRDKKLIIVSDPPFNINYKYKVYKDNLKENDYLDFMNDVFSDLPSVIVNYPEMLYKISHRINKFPMRVVSWVYNSNTGKQHRDIAFFDVIPDFGKVRQPYKNPNDKRIKERIARGCLGAKLYDWWNINQVKNVSKEKTEHPCQMPLEVMTNIISLLPDDCIIIDPFMGSGTTGVACKLLGKSFIGVEIDREYFDVAKERIKL